GVGSVCVKGSCEFGVRSCEFGVQRQPRGAAERFLKARQAPTKLSAPIAAAGHFGSRGGRGQDWRTVRLAFSLLTSAIKAFGRTWISLVAPRHPTSRHKFFFHSCHQTRGSNPSPPPVASACHASGSRFQKEGAKAVRMMASESGTMQRTE